MLPYILFEKYINILALDMACSGNRHCANCIGALSFPIKQLHHKRHFEHVTAIAQTGAGKYILLGK